MGAASPIIQLKNVSKSFSVKNGTVHALKDIAFAVNPGEIFGIIGVSGAGKSTLIRTINALERPTSGQVFVNNCELLSLNAQGLRKTRQQIGMIFQHFNLLSARTVYGNVALPLEIKGERRQDIAKIVRPLLEMVGLSDKEQAYPNQLSGGQKQRVAIARALATQPKVLLCDEATSSLDPQTTHSILSLLKDINRQLGLTLVLITHEMEVIKQVCTALAVIDKGEIVEQGAVFEVFSHPKTQITKALVNAMVKFDAQALSIDAHSAHEKNANPVLRLSFKGGAATQPVVALLNQKFNILSNILQANIEKLQNVTLGILVLELHLEQSAQLDEVIDFLVNHDVDVEVLGYANS